MFLSFSFTPWTHDVVCNIIRSKETKALYWVNRLWLVTYPLQLSPMFSRVLWKRVKGRARGILIRLAPFPPAVWSGPFSTAVWHKASSLACRAAFPPRQGLWGRVWRTVRRIEGRGQRLAFARGAETHRPTLEGWTDGGGEDCVVLPHKLHKSQRKLSSPPVRQIHSDTEQCLFQLHSTRERLLLFVSQTAWMCFHLIYDRRIVFVSSVSFMKCLNMSFLCFKFIYPFIKTFKI